MFEQRTEELVCEACGGAKSFTDALTGLADRTAFGRALEARLAEARLGWEPGRAVQPMGEAELAVVLIDLDRFKAVNDTLGHGAGDALLAAVGRRLRQAVRSADVPARLGGDEFVILLAAPLDQAMVAAVANRVIELLAQPYLIEGSIAHVGASAGAVIAFAGDGSTAEALLRQADLALYKAKAEGRGCLYFFEMQLQLRAEQRRLLEFDLRAALALNQFELFYQPQMDLELGQLTGFEALIRWRHPSRGLVPPDEFIKLTEELGLISSIGEWVIMTACREAMNWSDHYTVSVNVAAQQFDGGGLVAAVSAALSASGLSGARLELEITETALLRSGPSTLDQLAAIKTLGVQVSLDDFGTGYSSLTQLRSFAFDRVKIDRSFVDDEAVVRAVAALGRSLGMRTTAEGIENGEQITRLRSDGCSEVQGYLLSRPVPASEVMQLIKRLNERFPSRIAA